MKICCNLLALSVFPVWGTTAFIVPSRNSQPSVRLHAGSYLGELNALPNAGVDSDVAGLPSNFGNAEGSSPTPYVNPNTSGSPLKNANAPGGPPTPDMHFAKNIWDTSSPSTVQGGSLRTWSFSDPSVERVQVLMKTVGRPLSANVELWQGPNNSPLKMRIYIEDGALRPFSAVIETPRGQNAIAIRNTGQLEFPLSACVEGDESGGLKSVTERLSESGMSKIIQGGAIQTYPFAPAVASVQVGLKTDGRPLNARVELLQGPNNNKQVVEVYTEDGLERPFFMVIETPDSGNVVRIVNTGTVEFPMTISVEPYLVEPGSHASIAQQSGQGADSWWMDL
jgi:hypothetical protein